MSESPPPPTQNHIANIVDNFLENIVHPNVNTVYTQRAAFANAFNRLMRQEHLPIFQPQPPMTSVLEESFYNDTAIKKFASPQGIALLKNISYNTTDVINSTCPITFETFDENATVCVMPCKHGFNKTALLEWLQESNMCPICRHEVHCSESSTINCVSSNIHEEENTEVHDISNNTNSSINDNDDVINEDNTSNINYSNINDNGVHDTSNYVSTNHFFPLNQLINQSFAMNEQSLMQQALYNSIIENTTYDELENELGQELENMNDLSNETINEDADEEYN